MAPLTNLVRWIAVIFLLIISSLSNIVKCSSEEVELPTTSAPGLSHHHRHRHFLQNITVGNSPGQSEDNDPIAALSREGLERRLASLENDVKYLCMEDEEDVHRRVRHLGVKCICPTTEAPVCGSDHVTYHNRCFLLCHAKHALLNYHRHRITLKYFGQCDHQITEDHSSLND